MDFVECHLAGEVGKKNGSLPKLKNYTGNDLPGLYVSGHFTFRIASASLIERERQGKREKLLQTRAWFIKSSSLFVRASSLCMRNSEPVRRRMSRPSDGRRGMVVLNSAGNQLVKLNVKKKNDYVWLSDFSVISN